MENQRNPTEFNADLLRSWAMDYFTEKAAAFDECFKGHKYQAAVFIKDEFDAVYGFGQKYGAFRTEENEKIFGNEEKGIQPLVLPEKEATARMAVDNENVQSEVLRRFTNLVMRMRSSFRIRLKEEEAKTAILIMDEIMEQAEKASARLTRA